MKLASVSEDFCKRLSEKKIRILLFVDSCSLKIAIQIVSEELRKFR